MMKTLVYKYFLNHVYVYMSIILLCKSKIDRFLSYNGNKIYVSKNCLRLKVLRKSKAKSTHGKISWYYLYMILYNRTTYNGLFQRISIFVSTADDSRVTGQLGRVDIVREWIIYFRYRTYVYLVLLIMYSLFKQTIKQTNRRSNEKKFTVGPNPRPRTLTACA